MFGSGRSISGYLIDSRCFGYFQEFGYFQVFWVFSGIYSFSELPQIKLKYWVISNILSYMLPGVLITESIGVKF